MMISRTHMHSLHSAMFHVLSHSSYSTFHCTLSFTPQEPHKWQKAAAQVRLACGHEERGDPGSDEL
jgi:hypothetical protein